MIDIDKKENCCGCEACAQICPKQCIQMQQDEEGFWYPVVNKSNCVNCSLCIKVCPINKKKNLERFPEAFVVQLKDDNERFESASGGSFTAIAKYVLLRKGVVFGAAFDQKLVLRHTFTEFENDLERFRGSKYVQSQIRNSYKEAKDFLEKGRWVLFSGTPCQIEGLNRFLRKSYDKLITMDFVCHGVPSPYLFQRYIEFVECDQKKKVSNYLFRTKIGGYNNKSCSKALIRFVDGTSIYTHILPSYYNFMSRAFFAEISSRPSCHACQFKTRQRVSDFTVFDCWQVSSFVKNMDDKGTTFLVTQNSKAKMVLKELSKWLDIYSVDIEKAIKKDGISMIYSVKPNSKRNYFFRDLRTMEIPQLYDIYFKEMDKMTFNKLLHSILDRLGLLSYLRHLKYLIFNR